MRMAIFALLGLLVLGGAAAGGYFFFMKPAQASVGETEEHADAGKDSGDHGEGFGKKLQYVELDPLILPIVDKTGVTQTVSLIVMIEVDSQSAAQKVQELAPRLTDAYIQNMYGMLHKHEALPDGVVQVGMVKQRLNEVSREVLGADNFKDVLLQVVQQRRM